MAKHLSKMDDGHYIIETEEEYKNRTGGKIGCGGAILIAIIVAVYLIDGGDDKESKSSAPAAKETVAPKQESQPAEKNATYNAITEEQIDEDVVETTTPAETKTEVTIIGKENVSITEKFSDEVDYETASGTESESRGISITEAEKQVNELFNQVRKACQKKDVQAARKYLEEMNIVYISLGTSNQKIEKKINSVKNMIDKLEN